jgi:hypothetical protein
MVTDTIPNIYKQAKCNNNIITFEDDVSNDASHIDYKFTLNVCASQELYKLIQQQNVRP